MTLIADFFPKLRTPENLARYMSEKSRFKGPFDRQHGKQGSNTVAILTTALLPYLMIIWKVIESEKFCFSQIQSLITVY